MCGIVGYIGNKQALPILIAGLKSLEYRGYDSAGVAVTNGKAVLEKAVGPVANLEQKLSGMQVNGHAGVAHTRWATHGGPSQINAHPHQDCAGSLFVVHNGIIENHKELRTWLQERGHAFVSETDTETVPHLIEEFKKQGQENRSAILSALAMIRGAYAVAVLFADEPEKLYAAKLSSPLVVGVGENELLVASDPSAVIGTTRNVMYLQDHTLAELTEHGVTVTDLHNQPVNIDVQRLEWDLETIQKGKYPHFMLKEIFEGPETVRAAFSGRLKNGAVKLGGLESVAEQLKNTRRIIILGCGASYYAGLIGEFLFEETANIPTEVHLASEFRYRKEPFDPGTVAIAISQSGETADTLAALRKAKEAGLLTLGIVNAVGSTISRETDAGVYNHAGPEIGVVSTKAFLSQVTVLILMAQYLARQSDKALLAELEQVPKKLAAVLQKDEQIKQLAEKYYGYENSIFLGRRYCYPAALNGSLNLKEISYRHAEGYGAGEMKHGPIALISPEFATVAVVPNNSVAEKMYSNLEEIKSRKGPILAIATEGDQAIGSIATDVLYIPKTQEPFEPLLAAIAMQLLAYHAAAKLGCSIDRPRNLAKSVTVE